MTTFTKRSTQLWTLIILSAITMIIPYFIQGALSAGKSPDAIGAQTWLLDHIAWAIRAIVEGLVIGYIARTVANNRTQATILWMLKIALILLIALTLGPVLYASLNGLAMAQALPTIAQWCWAFGLAAYMPLMVLGAAYAYKVQPADTPTQIGATASSAEFEQLQSDLKKAQTQTSQLQAAVNGLQAEIKQAQTWESLSFADRAKWIAMNTNGDRPQAVELASAWGCSISTISRAYKAVDSQ